MKFSHDWLQTFFDTPLPAPEMLADAITFHSSEVEEVVVAGKDSVYDVKVLPDKSAWLLSHHGMACELSAILSIPMKGKPLPVAVDALAPERLMITRSSEVCDYYAAALVTGVKVGASPAWLKNRIEAVGGRSINNVVDATNYVLYELGQPLHAFDAGRLLMHDDRLGITVRKAQTNEKIVTLMGETCELTDEDTLIVDAQSDTPLAIAGVKGGQAAAVTEATTTILLESAHFDRVSTRKTARRLKLLTDAAKQFENGISVATAPIALQRAIALILDVAGGTCEAINFSGDTNVERAAVATSLKKINSVLGLTISAETVSDILNRFGFTFEWSDDMVTVTPTFWRDDIILEEDLIEEIGRIYGLAQIVAIPPEKRSLTGFNARHYYAERIREALTDIGFSEVLTSSFRESDIVKIENALASDKGYLRSSLVNNVTEARKRNIPHRDLLGLSAIQIFEIGTVFNQETEECRVALAVQTGTQYKAKYDDVLLQHARSVLEKTLGVTLLPLYEKEGVLEFSLDALVVNLAVPEVYEPVLARREARYKPFSVYPAVSRDIAVWINNTAGDVLAVGDLLAAAAGPALVRYTHLDTFEKDGKTSYAFRYIYQLLDRTLTDREVEGYMDAVYQAAKEAGFEVR